VVGRRESSGNAESAISHSPQQEIIMKPVLLASLLACVLGALACSTGKDAPVAVVGCDPLIHSVDVSPTTAAILIGMTVTLAASVDACPGVPRSVVWSTSDPSIATVDSIGAVTARATGRTRIIAAVSADTNVKGAATITVIRGDLFQTAK
jgi:Big-like domain-containing protein